MSYGVAVRGLGPWQGGRSMLETIKKVTSN